MWALVMVACLFIVSIIVPLSKFPIAQGDSLVFFKISVIQAILSVMIVGGLVIILNKFKKIYLYKKLADDGKKN